MINEIDEPNEQKSTFFEVLGGIEAIRSLVERFYDVMDSDPRASGIRAMHNKDLTSAREKLFMYLTGWTGGPQLYIERYGHPRLRARHLPFSIGESERDQWIYCMVRAMHDLNYDEHVMKQLGSAFWEIADFMRNKPLEAV